MLKSKVQCEQCSFEKILQSEKLQHKARIKCPSCKNPFTYNKNIWFENSTEYKSISADDFMHPLDRSALNSIKAIPGLDKYTTKMMKYSYEKFVRVNELADDIRVTPRTCSYIYDMTKEAAKILDIPVPNLYINQNPVVNAYTTCVDDPIIVISSGLLELCDDEELYATIAHEMGHIKCEHVLYHMLVDFMAMFPDLLGITKLITGGIQLALLEWYRKSELSADRCALVVTGNREKITSLLMKMAGGTSKVMNMIDHDDFKSQYEEWEKLMNNVSDKMIQKLMTMFRTHPFPIIRAYEISRWGGLNSPEISASQSREVENNRDAEDKYRVA